MDVTVYDKFGNKLGQADAEEMVARHGLSWEIPPVLSPGDRYFKLTELREKPSSSLIYRVLDLYGNPIINPDETMDRSKAHRAFYWSSIDDEANDIEIPFSTDHYGKADLGGLNQNGEGGSGMGRGAYHDPYEPGPHECWVRHPNVWSVLVKGQGMEGGTDHVHLDMTFQEMVFTDAEPPLEEPEEVIELLKGIKSDTGRQVTLLTQILEALGEEPGPPVAEFFQAEYFANMNLEGEPVLTRHEEEINHFWGDGSPGIPIPADYFSARWTGEFTFGEGDCHFHVLVDDGFRLWIDNHLLVEAWKPQAPTQYDATITLTAGKHHIRAEYYEQAGGATCRLWWD